MRKPGGVRQLARDGRSQQSPAGSGASLYFYRQWSTGYIDRIEVVVTCTPTDCNTWTTTGWITITD